MKKCSILVVDGMNFLSLFAIDLCRGTLSVHAAKLGANVTGITLGRNQAQWGLNQAKEAGVSDKVRILCTDYRDIPKEKYNKISCLEMAEHVGTPLKLRLKHC